MKRLVTVLSVLVLGTAALPAAADPGGWAEGYQLAEADWLVMQSRTDAKFYFGLALRAASPDGLQTYGVIGSGDCDVKRSKHWTMISCVGHGRVKQLAIDQFQFDPALRSAFLEMKLDGVKNVVRWRGLGSAPAYGGSVFGDEAFAGADAGMFRWAASKGRILGRKMPTGRDRHPMSFSFLAQGGTAYAFTGYRGRTLDIAPDGTYTYTVETRIPR